MTIKSKWEEYKKITGRKVSYAFFRDKYSVKKISFEDILKMPFKHGGNTRKSNGLIKKAWEKAKEEGYKYTYTYYCRNIKKDKSLIYIKEDSIKSKYNEYKKLTPYSPCTYVTFWNYYTIERQSFEEIVNTKFSKGGPRTLGLGEITNAFNKAKEKGYASVYSTYYKRLKNNTLELKRR